MLGEVQFVLVLCFSVGLVFFIVVYVQLSPFSCHHFPSRISHPQSFPPLAWSTCSLLLSHTIKLGPRRGAPRRSRAGSRAGESCMRAHIWPASAQPAPRRIGNRGPLEHLCTLLSPMFPLKDQVGNEPRGHHPNLCRVRARLGCLETSVWGLSGVSGPDTSLPSCEVKGGQCGGSQASLHGTPCPQVSASSP